MELPKGYEAHIVPRSSTYKNFGVIQANHCGIVDGSYCGDNDMWRMPVIAMRDTEIHVNDRICQFRIMKNQPQIQFDEVDKLAGKDTLEFTVCGHEDQTMVTARFDNLGKGASGAAVQNMNLMLGFEETTGLAL